MSQQRKIFELIQPQISKKSVCLCKHRLGLHSAADVEDVTESATTPAEDVNQEPCLESAVTAPPPGPVTPSC